jgi:hypothetical protein
VKFEEHVLGKIFETLARAKPNEGIAYCSGSTLRGQSLIEKFWGCELEYANSFSAKPRSEWLFQFAEKLVQSYPQHNTILAAHSHSIGSKLSIIDEDTLRALTDWNHEMYFLMVAIDFKLGCHFVYEGNVESIEWVVGECENKPSEAETCSTT